MRGAWQGSAVALMLALGLVHEVRAQEATPQARSNARYQIIAHPEVPVAKLTRRQLFDVFTKRVTQWPRGETIFPVDVRSDSPLRRDFVVEELQTTVQAIKNYWQQQIFSGRNVPPPELDTDAQVLRYVLRNPGAIGYISAATSAGGAKIIAVE